MTTFFNFLFAVLTGNRSDYVNIILDNNFVFCHPCGASIGRVFPNGVIVIRHARFARVDPRYLLSYCVGRIHDASGNIIPHRHLPHMATMENSVTASILPVELISYRNNRRLNTRCPFANNFQIHPEDTSLAQRFISANMPRTSTETIDSSVRTDANVLVLSNTSTSSVNTNDNNTNTATSVAQVVTTNAPVPAINILPNRSLEHNLDTFINEQPSTSSGTYREPVQQVINVRKRLRRNNNKSASKLKCPTISGTETVSFFVFVYFCFFVEFVFYLWIFFYIPFFVIIFSAIEQNFANGKLY